MQDPLGDGETGRTEGISGGPSDKGISAGPSDKGISAGPSDKGISAGPSDKGISAGPSDKDISGSPSCRVQSHRVTQNYARPAVSNVVPFSTSYEPTIYIFICKLSRPQANILLNCIRLKL